MIIIYAIYYKEILLYIGSTDRIVKERFSEHKRDLKKCKHSNKTLQKYFTENCESVDDLRFEVLYSLDTDNSLVRYTLEMFSISLLRPICNRCVIQQGNKMMTFKRIDNKDMCEEVIKAIVNR